MTIKRIFISLIIVMTVILWSIRFVSLNHGFHISSQYKQEFYNIGETVEFGHNMSSGMKYYYNYSISVDNYKIYDADEYIKFLNKSKRDFQFLIPKKVVELNVTLHNNGDNNEEILFTSLQLVGVDWYEYFNSEFTAYANTIYNNDASSAYGIILKPHDSYSMKIIYGISPEGRTRKQWKNIESAYMNLEITLNPVNKIIRLN